MKLTDPYKILLFDSIHNPIAVINKNGSVLYVNTAFQNITNKNFIEQNNLSISDYFGVDKGSNLLKKILKALQENQMVNATYQINKNWYCVSINPISDPEYQNECALVIANDITQLMEMQNELNRLAEDLEQSRDAVEENATKLAKAYDELEYQRQELESFSKKLEVQNRLLLESEEKEKILNAQKDKFVSIISHDLRAPFTSILGYSEALLSTWDSIAVEEKKEFIGIINKSAKSQLELLDTLLQWSRLETGRVQVRPEVINMYQLAKNCVFNLSGIAQKKQISIVNSIPENINVLGDHLLLSQVIQNLISNSLKFTKSGGSITLFSNGKTENNYIMFKLIDTGIGMPESIRSKLFKIDSKVSRKGTSGEAGTGLGLIVCKEIIDLHDGSILVESKEGEGTIFSFTLPNSYPGILIVSDDPKDIELLHNLVKENYTDHEAVFVRNFRESEDYLEKSNYSLIIYENSILEEDDDFLEYIKKTSKMKLTPIILITTINKQEILESFLHNGVDFIIPRPIDVNKMTDTCNRIFYAMVVE
jgi:PAS domain S-box-containing protein